MMSDNGDNRTQADYDYELLEQAYKELKAQNAELQAEVLALFRKGQTLIDEKADLQRDIEMCHDERISQNSGTE